MSESKKMPLWYWSRGLHDAEVTEVAELTLPVDWKATVRRWNCLLVGLDCRGALFETGIRRILLYNYKILSGDLELLRQPRTWWYADKLEPDDKGYRLTVIFESAHSDRFEIQLRFEDATVEHKPKK